LSSRIDEFAANPNKPMRKLEILSVQGDDNGEMWDTLERNHDDRFAQEHAFTDESTSVVDPI
jgi:hypothetical protein